MAEKRARVAHDLEQTDRLMEELATRAESLRADLAAMNRAITLYDANLDPASIEAIAGWKGRYGKRGNLRGTVEAILQERAPEWVSTDNIEMLVLARLGLAFETAAQRKRWHDNCLTGRLRKLVAEGVVERLQDPTRNAGVVGWWRWKQAEKSTSLAVLRASAGKPLAP
ncbi:MAG: hypothetical protein JOY60_10955 [Burkholderiaceae bacterium]|nr:hypothetical protein [Burkholderiaceae bacterium]